MKSIRFSEAEEGVRASGMCFGRMEFVLKMTIDQDGGTGFRAQAQWKIRRWGDKSGHGSPSSFAIDLSSSTEEINMRYWKTYYVGPSLAECLDPPHDVAPLPNVWIRHCSGNT